MKSVMLLSTLLLLLAIVAPAMAQENRVEVRKNKFIAASQPPGPTDPAELEAFMDGLLKTEMMRTTLHARDGCGRRFHLVPELLEPVRLAVLKVHALSSRSSFFGQAKHTYLM